MDTFKTVVVVSGVFLGLVAIVGALVGLWLWQRGKRVPPAPRPDDRHTTLIGR